MKYICIASLMVISLYSMDKSNQEITSLNISKYALEQLALQEVHSENKGPFEQIISYVGHRDAVNLSMTCKTFKNVIDYPQIAGKFCKAYAGLLEFTIRHPTFDEDFFRLLDKGEQTNTFKLINPLIIFKRLYSVKLPLEIIGVATYEDCMNQYYAIAQDCFTLLGLVAMSNREQALEIFLSKLPQDILNTPFVSGQLSPLFLQGHLPLVREMKLLKKYNFNFNQLMTVKSIYIDNLYDKVPPLAYYIIMSKEWRRLDDDINMAIDNMKDNIEWLMDYGSNPQQKFNVLLLYENMSIYTYLSDLSRKKKYKILANEVLSCLRKHNTARNKYKKILNKAKTSARKLI